ncbi:hypothetical protein C8R45DRAFT_1051388 [Mycena sanguinolenta]|nr:hypothetical protein C8R45DRAFT_1051388 [Mycena sanguinolenta]
MARTRTALLALLGLAFATGCSSARSVCNLPGTVSNGTSQAQFISGATGLNAPKVHPINASAYDLWYFDVVSTDPNSKASVVVVFFDTAPGTFPFVAPSNTTLTASLTISFPNGTLASIGLGSEPANDATIVADGNGSSGDWNGSGFSWTYNVGSGAYDVFIDSPQLDVKGQIHFQPRNAPRYPCGPAVAGQNMELVPNAGYANPVPDAISTVDLLVGGTKLAFAGAGYADQGWGPQPFAAAVGSWYWGHGRVGPYSVVWFDILTPSGVEYVSAYVAKDDAVLINSCDLARSQVRPTGVNATYPPHVSAGKPSGYHITMDLGAEGVLDMNVSVVAPLISIPQYMRAVGYIHGSITPHRGPAGPIMGGVTLLEQFTLEP